jgi:hypothetical protein
MLSASSAGRRAAPLLYRPAKRPAPSSAKNWRQVILLVPLFAILGVLLNSWFGVDHYDTSYSALLGISVQQQKQKQQQQHPEQQKPIRAPPKVSSIGSTTSSTEHEQQESWCDRVKQARADLSPALHIHVPCETMKPAKSAIVCMLTDGVSDDKATKVVFTATNYIHGAMALGASLMDRIDHTQTHQLLLLREGFTLAPDDYLRLESVGWIIGTAPEVPLKKKFLPRFPRYKTTYTKISAIGLAEYDCAMLMDADTLAVGDLRDIMTCQIFTEPQHRVGGTLDYYRGHWHYFNTGSVLWRPSAKEMDRVFQLTVDPSFMKAFSSDQDFLNNVYPERLNNTVNYQIMQGNYKYIPNGQVVDMTWDYNAQTHVEVEQSKWWESKRPTVKILHYTQKKGWQCDERHEPPPPLSEMPTKCDKEIPLCYCREAHLYWNALTKAHTLANRTIALAHATNGGK